MGHTNKLTHIRLRQNRFIANSSSRSLASRPFIFHFESVIKILREGDDNFYLCFNFNSNFNCISCSGQCQLQCQLEFQTRFLFLFLFIRRLQFLFRFQYQFQAQNKARWSENRENEKPARAIITITQSHTKKHETRGDKKEYFCKRLSNRAVRMARYFSWHIRQCLTALCVEYKKQIQKPWTNENKMN